MISDPCGFKPSGVGEATHRCQAPKTPIPRLGGSGRRLRARFRVFFFFFGGGGGVLIKDFAGFRVF